MTFLSEEQILNQIFNDVNNALVVKLLSGDVTIDAGDIEIGAVELKDATGTNRAAIDSSGNLSVADTASHTVLGATNDSVVAGDSNGSINSRLRYIAKMFADLWDTSNHALYIRHKTGSVVTEVAAGTGNSAITASAGRLHGFSLRETTGTATALVYLRDGTSTSGSIVSVISLAPGESVRDYFGDRSLAIGTGIYLHRSSGNVEGAIYSGVA